MGCRRTFGDKDLRLIDPEIKALALSMYAEGIAARKIERISRVSHNAVLGWVGFAKKLLAKPLKHQQPKTYQSLKPMRCGVTRAQKIAHLAVVGNRQS
jgi:hypothetical protein